ncbi:cytidine deaminase [Balneatrix alpica]|uniref:Cytidine deaminase n=1 Tax=Balneatrix alpica TaxID=75684 RepID=A0ABV5ZBW2_9GAMM|nr:cytidine deaminase [Balneatrix alpica]
MAVELTPAVFASMKSLAQTAASRAYIPYSRFPVGAALQLKDGTLIPGCNVENVSYGLSNCAERTAIYAALAQGYQAKDFANLLIYMPGGRLYSPCGACRQVIAEFFAAEAEVIATCDTEQQQRWQVAELLPASFQFAPAQEIPS